MNNYKYKFLNIWYLILDILGGRVLKGNQKLACPSPSFFPQLVQRHRNFYPPLYIPCDLGNKILQVGRVHSLKQLYCRFLLGSVDVGYKVIGVTALFPPYRGQIFVLFPRPRRLHPMHSEFEPLFSHGAALFPWWGWSGWSFWGLERIDVCHTIVAWEGNSGSSQQHQA